MSPRLAATASNDPLPRSAPLPRPSRPPLPWPEGIKPKPRFLDSACFPPRGTQRGAPGRQTPLAACPLPCGTPSRGPPSTTFPARTPAPPLRHRPDAAVLPCPAEAALLPGALDVLASRSQRKRLPLNRPSALGALLAPAAGLTWFTWSGEGSPADLDSYLALRPLASACWVPFQGSSPRIPGHGTITPACPLIAHPVPAGIARWPTA